MILGQGLRHRHPEKINRTRYFRFLLSDQVHALLMVYADAVLVWFYSLRLTLRTVSETTMIGLLRT